MHVSRTRAVRVRPPHHIHPRRATLRRNDSEHAAHAHGDAKDSPGPHTAKVTSVTC